MRKIVFCVWAASVGLGLIFFIYFCTAGNCAAGLWLLLIFGVILPAVINAPYACAAARKALTGKCRCPKCLCGEAPAQEELVPVSETEPAAAETATVNIAPEEPAAESVDSEQQQTGTVLVSRQKKTGRGLCRFFTAFSFFFGGLIFAFVWIPVRMCISKTSYKDFCNW